MCDVSHEPYAGEMPSAHGSPPPVRRGRCRGLFVALGALTMPPIMIGGCPAAGTGDRAGAAPVFNNTNDPLNGGAGYIGSAACSACHADVADRARLHAHRFALTPVVGRRPAFPEEGTRAGVPEPPGTSEWADVSYLIGGYTHAALFVDAQGYILTDGLAGVSTQWTLAFPPTDTTAAFVPFQPDRVNALPLQYECFRCHTTGAAAATAGAPSSQDGRPGIGGTWAEAAVGCEACHGPGSRHLPNPGARDLFVDATPATCGGCHTAGADPDVIPVIGGYIHPYAQYNELRASGGHADFNCTVCHDPHASTVYDRVNGIRNTCSTCHSDANMAAHAGVVFVRGTYREPVTCESCHMPFAALSAAAAAQTVVGTTGRMGDVRSHIFRIATRAADYRDLFSTDGSRVLKDAHGRAAVTVDFVCLRCHTDDSAMPNSAFYLSPESAWQIATGLHRLPQ